MSSCDHAGVLIMWLIGSITEGIHEVNTDRVGLTDTYRVFNKDGSWDLYHLGNRLFHSREAAVATAEIMRIAEICKIKQEIRRMAGKKRRLKKLEQLRFDVVELYVTDDNKGTVL